MRRLRALPVLAFLALAFFGLAELTACPPPADPPHAEATDGYPPGPSDPADAEDPPIETATFPICAKACAALKRLGCPEAERPDGGSTCYALCAKAEASGKFGLRPSCVAASKTQADTRACGTIRCQSK